MVHFKILHSLNKISSWNVCMGTTSNCPFLHCIICYWLCNVYWTPPIVEAARLHQWRSVKCLLWYERDMESSNAQPNRLHLGWCNCCVNLISFSNCRSNTVLVFHSILNKSIITFLFCNKVRFASVVRGCLLTHTSILQHIQTGLTFSSHGRMKGKISLFEIERTNSHRCSPFYHCETMWRCVFLSKVKLYWKCVNKNL